MVKGAGEPAKDDPVKNPLIVAPNLNSRLSGVTSTIVRLVPLQAKKIPITAFGYGLPESVKKIGLKDLLLLGFKTPPHNEAKARARVWHARRNVEMLLGLVLKHIMRQRWKLLFTSASQRQHTVWSRFLISRMDRVIATSNAGKAYLKVPADIVYHGIDVEAFSPPKDRGKIKKAIGLADKKLIGCFGRIRRQKGTDLFVDTMIDLLPDYPEWSAIILGRATEAHQGFLKQQKQKIARAGLENRILFMGEVSPDQMPDWYRALDLFIAPQRWEGFGLTPLEAMACGVPVVATRAGAFAELVEDGRTGFVIDRDNLEQMIEQTAHLMKNEKQLARFSKAARKRCVDHFKIENEADHLIEIYRQLSQS